MPAGVMISRITVRDPAKLKEYLGAVREVAGKHGAEMMFRGAKKRVLNGEAETHDMLVIVRFPSSEAASAWFDDPDYAPLVALREAGGDMEMVTYEAMSS